MDTERRSALLTIDMESVEIALELENSAALTRVSAFVDTPALVIGRTVVQGQINDKMIRQIVKLEREEDWDVAMFQRRAPARMPCAPALAV